MIEEYKKLIESAKFRGLRRNKKKYGYTEIHHIIPRCIGGTDDKENLVQLTGQEHYEAHRLLAKIHKGNISIEMAWWAMVSQCDSYGRRIKISAGDYAEARELASKNQTILNKIRWEDPEYKNKVSNSIRKTLHSKNAYFSAPTKNKLFSIWLNKPMSAHNFNKKISSEYPELYKNLPMAALINHFENTSGIKHIPMTNKEIVSLPGYQDKKGKSHSKRLNSPEGKAKNSAAQKKAQNRPDVILKKRLANRKSVIWQEPMYSELYKLWAVDKLKARNFKNLAVTKGFPDVSYECMVKNFKKGIL